MVGVNRGGQESTCTTQHFVGHLKCIERKFGWDTGFINLAHQQKVQISSDKNKVKEQVMDEDEDYCLSATAAGLQ